MNKIIRQWQVYPSILTGDLQTATRQLQLARQSKASIVQLDIIDGFYADNLTLTPTDFAEFEFGQLQVDFHLMVEEPLDYVYEILEHKKNLPVRGIIAQVERMSSQLEYIHLVKEVGWLAGLSLDLYTPLESVEDRIWPELDLIQVMAVEAGFQAQTFFTQALETIKALTKLRSQLGLKFEIVADGGVKPDLLASLKLAGADSVAVGSFLWQARDFKTMYDSLL